MPDSGVTPPIALGLKAVITAIVAALTLSGLYWKNAIEISHLASDMEHVKADTDKQEAAIRELQVQMAEMRAQQRAGK